MSDCLPTRIEEALQPYGLIQRGGFDFSQDDKAPPGRGTAAARAVLLVGSSGGRWWPHFLAWLETRPDRPRHPLDEWSREILETIAEQHAARAVFPSDQPFLPFQQWAMRAEGLRPSPLGLLIHPEFGLWHAYRGALLFDRGLDLPPARVSAHPCDQCEQRPCLSACPVGAHSLDGFAVQACRDWLAGEDSLSCREYGCLARNACPVGTNWRLSAEVQQFHQVAFIRKSS